MSLKKFSQNIEIRIRRFLFWLIPIFLIFLISKLVLNVNGYQDAGTIIDASKALAIRENPYENDFFLNGYLLAIPAYIYNILFPVTVGARLYVLVNIFLITLLVWDFNKKRGVRNYIVTLVLVLASSPTRSMIASVQHTGLILGLSYFSFKIGLSWNPHTKFQRLIKYVLISISLIIPIELKPQLTFPLIVVFLYHQKLRRYIASTFCLGLFGHLALSFKLRMPLDKFWLERLLSRSSETTAAASRENSPWTLIGTIFGYPKIWLGLSFLLFIVLIVGLLRIIGKIPTKQNHFLLAFTIPIVLSYIHPYDLILSVIIVATFFISDSKVRGSTFLISLFLFPTLGLNFASFSISSAIIILSWYMSGTKFRYWRSEIVELFFSVIIYFSINLFAEDLGLRVNLHMSILIVGSLIFTASRFTIPELVNSRGKIPRITLKSNPV